MDAQRIKELTSVYRDGLLEDVLPFWTRHAVDHEHGGFTFCRDRDGSLLDSDKGIWQHGRFTWLLGSLHANVEPREEWYELARHGIEFMRSHAFVDGPQAERPYMWFHVTKDGRPLRRRRYAFTESFGAISFAAWAQISGDQAAAATARRLFELTTDSLLHGAPHPLGAKFEPTRPTRGLGGPMITLVTAQIMRETIGHERADAVIDEALAALRMFAKPELEAVMEVVAPDGAVLDHFGGRMLTPGHAIEAAWFVLAEARHRGGDAELVELGTNMLDWSWKRGWDDEHGGLLYFVDLHGKPVQEYWHDMKFWWVHNEAILATLYAYLATGEARYASWHEQVHDWTYRHFPDPEHGEWFGYLHRDGRISVPLKGNMWKGPFHIPRMQLLAWKLCEELRVP